MPVTSDALRKLAALSLSPEQMSGVLDILADLESAEEHRKAGQRERVRRHREKARYGNVTETFQQRDQSVTAPSLEEKREVSPCTPSREKTQLSPDLAPLGDTQGATEREIDGKGTAPKRTPTRSPAASTEHEAFPEFLAVFPRRLGTNTSREEASRKFDRAIRSGADPGRIIDGARRYRDQCIATGKLGADGKNRTEFVQQIARWLNNRGWEEAYELPDQPPRQPPSGDRHPPAGPVDPLHAAIGRKLQGIRDRERFADPAPRPAGQDQGRDPFPHVGDRMQPVDPGFGSRDLGRDHDGLFDAPPVGR